MLLVTWRNAVGAIGPFQTRALTAFDLLRSEPVRTRTSSGRSALGLSMPSRQMLMPAISRLEDVAPLSFLTLAGHRSTPRVALELL
jgi:hypothetical protein